MQSWLSLWSLGPEVVADDLHRAQAAGFAGVEVWGEHARAAEHLRWAQRAGLGVSLHLPFHDLNPVTPDGVVRDRMRQVCRRWLDDLAAAGGRHAVFHGGYAWTFEEREAALARADERLSELDAWARERGLRLLLENLVPDALHYTHHVASNLDEWCGLLERANLGACLDTGHLAISGPDYRSALTRLGTRLQSIHLSDNDRKADWHLWPGDGAGITEGFLDALTSDGYDGPVVYEINPYRYASAEIFARAEAMLLHATEGA